MFVYADELLMGFARPPATQRTPTAATAGGGAAVRLTDDEVVVRWAGLTGSWSTAAVASEEPIAYDASRGPDTAPRKGEVGAAGVAETVWGEVGAAVGVAETVWGEVGVAAGAAETVWGEVGVAAGAAGTVWGEADSLRGNAERVGSDAGSAAVALAGVGRAVTGLAEAHGWLRQVEAQLEAGEAGPGLRGALAALVEGLGRVDSGVAAAVSRAVVAAELAGCADDDGQPSPSGWVADRLRMSDRAAARATRLAAGLDALPDVLAALESGEISRDHAAELVEAARQQRRDQGAAERAWRKAAAEAERRAREHAEAAERAAADQAERQRIRREAVEDARRRQAEAEQAAQQRAERAARERAARQADLLGRARTGDSPDEVAGEADRLRAADPETLLRSEAAQWQGRSLRTWKDPVNGAGRGVWSLPWDEHETLLAVLEALRSHDPAGCEPAERRSFEQRQADAFIDLIGMAAGVAEAPTTRGQRPHLHVTVPLEALATDAVMAGRTRYGTWLSPEAVARIGCDAKLVRIVLGAASQVLDVGRATREWTAAQFTAAEQTFGGCGFPVGDGRMCGRPAGWTELHHVHWWRRGGSTDQDNGVLLCKGHHWAVHHEGWDLVYDHAGRQVGVTRRRPDGTTSRRTVYLARPPNHRGSDPPAGAPATTGTNGGGRGSGVPANVHVPCGPGSRPADQPDQWPGPSQGQQLRALL